LDKTLLKINPSEFVNEYNIRQEYKRCTIPKKNLNRILD
jgi:hypothetical protein